MKNLSLLIVLLFVLLALSSCFYSQDPIVGNWNLTSITVNGNSGLNANSITSLVLTISNNYTWSAVEVSFPVASSIPSSGTWSLSTTTYTLTETTPASIILTGSYSGTLTFSGTVSARAHRRSIHPAIVLNPGANSFPMEECMSDTAPVREGIMKMLSFGHVRIALLFFVIFFGISAVAQFLFVRSQSDQVVEKDVSDGANSLNQAIAYDNGINLNNYNKADIRAANYYVVFNDGSLFDYSPDLKVGVPDGMIPPVQCPVLTDKVLKAPTVVSYLGPAQAPERWTLYAKRFEKGYVVVGVSEYDHVSGAEDALQTNLRYFGSTLESAKKVNVSRIDSFISYALVDGKGMLINGGGRIPLITNAIKIGKDSERSPHRTYGKDSYYVWYAPIADKTGKQVGTTIVTEEINSTEAMVRNMLAFSMIVAFISIVVFLILTSIYNSRNEKAKRQIRESFQKYFSPQILQTILKEPDKLKLGGQRREITVLFSDIRSFTALAERLPPAALSVFLQEYFNEMTEAVFATDGIVDKYIGDAVMAFWGAPIEQTGSSRPSGEDGARHDDQGPSASRKVGQRRLLTS